MGPFPSSLEISQKMIPPIGHTSAAGWPIDATCMPEHGRSLLLLLGNPQPVTSSLQAE